MDGIILPAPPPELYAQEPGHDALCAWPYRPCAADCGVAVEATSPKFSSALAERLWTLSLDSNQDEQLGEAETFGWYALFLSDRAVVFADSQGFVHAAQYDSEPETRAQWTDLERAYEVFGVQSIIDALDTSECDDLFLIIDTARHLGNTPDRSELVDHIQMHRECWDQYSWVLDI